MQGESRAFEGRLVSSESPLGIQDRDEGVVGGTEEKKVFSKRGHCFAIQENQ